MTNVGFNRRQVQGVFFTGQADGVTACASTACTTDTVYVVFAIVRQIVVKDVRNGRNVQAARGNVGCHQDIQVATGEFVENTQTFFLRHIAGQQANAMTIGGQIDFAVAPLTAASGSGLAMPALFAEKRNPAIPDVPTVKEQGYDVSPLSIGGMFGPAGLPAEIKSKLENACKTAVQSEPFQKMVKQTLQPADWFQDSAGFAANLAKDVESKRKLLGALGMIK